MAGPNRSAISSAKQCDYATKDEVGCIIAPLCLSGLRQLQFHQHSQTILISLAQRQR